MKKLFMAFLLVLALPLQAQTTKTICAVGGDYATFDAAVSAASGFVALPITFNVCPGTYNEQITLGAILQRVTFQSSTANAADVNLTFSSTAQNYVVKVDGADFMTFKNMSISVKTTTANPDPTVSDGRLIWVVGDKLSEGLTFDGVVFTGEPFTSLANGAINSYTTNAGEHDLIYFQNPTAASNCTRTFALKNSRLNHGSRQLYQGAGSYSCASVDNLIENNSFNGYVWYGAFLQYQRNPIIRGNTFVSRECLDFATGNCGSSAGAALYISNLVPNYPALIDKNKIVVHAGIGLFLNTAIGTSGSTDYRNSTQDVLITNNMLYRAATGGPGGDLVSFGSSAHTRFLFNSVYNNKTSTSSQAVYLSSQPSPIDYPTAVLELSYNIIHSTNGRGINYSSGYNANNVSDYNFYSGNVTCPLYYFGCSTLSAWQTSAAAPRDAKSKVGTASFVDATTGDLHLTSPSNGDMNMSAPIHNLVPQDLDAQTRSAWTYKGADQASIAVGTDVELPQGVTLGIYPNPFQNNIHIQTELQVKEVVLIDILGREVLKSSKLSLDTQNLPAGFYTLRIVLANGVSTTRTLVKN